MAEEGWGEKEIFTNEGGEGEVKLFSCNLKQVGYTR